MENYKHIQHKIKAFIKKYYVNELIKGGILFFSLSLIYLLILVSLEHFLWMNSLSRSILFWSFVATSGVLFIKFILIPLFQLFRIAKGVTEEQAAKQIGHHFPEVSDKLLNLLQLHKQEHQSNLWLASIDQKAQELRPIPFRFAINFRSNLPYLKYAIFPLLVVLVIYFSGKINLFSSSYKRIVHYEKAYVPPAPFRFSIQNKRLKVRQKEHFLLKVVVDGRYLPENINIHFNDENYFLTETSSGHFQYEFIAPEKNLSFFLSANKVRSKTYTLDVVLVPQLISLEMQLDYPGYTRKKDETLKGTGNAQIPEGTKIRWTLQSKNTKRIKLSIADSVSIFNRENTFFSLDKTLYHSVNYSIATANENTGDYENLAYELDVIQDAPPKLNLQVKRDSSILSTYYFKGQISDDYGLTRLEIIYYPSQSKEKKQKKNIPISNSNYDSFLARFPGNLKLKPGVTYAFFFQVFDNDAVHGSKNTKSKIFVYRKLSRDAKNKKLLQHQKKNIEQLSQSLEKLNHFESKFKDISRLQKQQRNWSYTERKKLQNFLNQQKRQREMMLRYNKKLQKNLSQFTPEKKEDPYKESLLKRLRRNEKKLKGTEALLRKLEAYSKKIRSENLSEELQKLAKQNTSQQRNLKQLLELTKRYYVEQKTERLSEDLQNLGRQQKKLSQTKQKNSIEKQREINKKFNSIRKELEGLRKENKTLKKPMPLGTEPKTEKEINRLQKEATEKLKESEQQNKPGKSSKKQAQQKQQKAGEKMQQLSKKMSQKMSSFSTISLKADAEMLRQILDNLLTFSIQQEALMETFLNMDKTSPIYVEKLKRQNSLRTNFEHVDDSLFSLALRNPKIAGTITEKVTEVSFQLDKSITLLEDNKTRPATASQQYTVTQANELALFLDRILSNMRQQMGMGKSGKGNKPRGFQLQDIIKKQGEIGKSLKEQLQKQGKKQGKKSGKQGEKGKAGLYQIYQKQQRLRMALEKKIKESGLGKQAKNIVQKMKNTEKSLINQGGSSSLLQQILSLKHQLLELKNAAYQQGSKQKRQSESNQKKYNNNTSDSWMKAKEYFQNTEILNRQDLPLRQNYKELVKDYFRKRKSASDPH